MLNYLDDKNQVVLQDKIEMTDAKGNGSFLLPANIPTGNYQIIAYTNWMKNFDQSFSLKKRSKLLIHYTLQNWCQIKIQIIKSLFFQKAAIC